jgi:hypothetical protein
VQNKKSLEKSRDFLFLIASIKAIIFVVPTTVVYYLSFYILINQNIYFKKIKEFVVPTTVVSSLIPVNITEILEIYCLHLFIF